jgi:hypothetical protein
MQPSPEPIEKLIKSFEEIQRLLESIRASKQKIIDGYKSHGSSETEALQKFHDDVRRLQATADSTSLEIRALLNQ